MQRALEARGIATVSLSMIPELTRAVSVPRLAGIGCDASKDHPPPPNVELLRRKPWLLADLYRGRVPDERD